MLYCQGVCCDVVVIAAWSVDGNGLLYGRAGMSCNWVRHLSIYVTIQNEPVEAIKPIFPAVHLRITAQVPIHARSVRYAPLISQRHRFTSLPSRTEEALVHEERQCIGGIDPVLRTQLVERLPFSSRWGVVAGENPIDESRRDGWLPNKTEPSWPHNGGKASPPAHELTACEGTPVVQGRIGQPHRTAVTACDNEKVTPWIPGGWKAHNCRGSAVGKGDYLIERQVVTPVGCKAKPLRSSLNSLIIEQAKPWRNSVDGNFLGEDVLNAISICIHD